MIAGITFIIAGILIAVYPQLLSLIAAFLLILIGVFFIALNSYYRRVSRQFDDPFMNFFFRL